MRNSLYLTAMTAVGIILATSAMAETGRNSLEAQSTSSAQVQSESKGFFSGFGDRMHGFFNRDRNVDADIETNTVAQSGANGDASGGILVQNDTSAGAGVDTSADRVNDDTVENNEAGAAGSASTSSSTGVGLGVGGVNANVGINADVDADTDLDAQARGVNSTNGSLSSQTGGSVSGSAGLNN